MAEAALGAAEPQAPVEEAATALALFRSGCGAAAFYGQLCLNSIPSLFTL